MVVQLFSLERQGLRGLGCKILLAVSLLLLVLNPELCRAKPVAPRGELLSRLTALTVHNSTSSLASDSTVLGGRKYALHECERHLDVPSVKGPSRSCSAKKYVEWSEVSILVYKPKNVQRLIEAAAARNVKEIIAFDLLGSQPDGELIKALSGPNHFIIFSSKELDAAHAFNKMGQMANSELIAMVVGGQEEALKDSLGSRVLDNFKKEKNLSLITTTTSISHDGMAGSTPKNRKTPVMAALFGPLIARRSAFIDSGMFHTGHPNECLQLNALDISLRLQNLGYAVVSFPTGNNNNPEQVDIAAVSNLNSAQCKNLGENVYMKREVTERKKCYRASDFQSRTPPGSLIVQYFMRSGNIKDIVDSFKRYKSKAELIINDDSRSDYAEWAKALAGWANAFLVYSPNIHEIRGYNRLTQFSDSELIVYLQDDDLGAQNLDWLSKAQKLFGNHPDMALLGGFRGRMDFGTTMDSKKHLIQGPKFGVPSANPRCCFKIPWKDSKSGIPFMFVYKVNMGPMMARRSVFLKLGMYHPGFSCAGDPGIGFDYEFSIRAWKFGYKVGLTVSEFKNRVGSSMKSGTHSGQQKKIRDANEIVNNRAVYRMYSGFHHKQGTRKASTANKELKGPNWRGYFTDKKADEAYKKTTRGYRREQQRLKRGQVGGSRWQRWQRLLNRQNKKGGRNSRSGRSKRGGSGRKRGNKKA